MRVRYHSRFFARKMSAKETPKEAPKDVEMKDATSDKAQAPPAPKELTPAEKEALLVAGIKYSFHGVVIFRIRFKAEFNIAETSDCN